MEKLNEPIPVEEKYTQLLERIAASSAYFHTKGGFSYEGSLNEQGEFEGPCRFYFKQRQFGANSPVILITSIQNNPKKYADKTLIIFENLSYYIGEIADYEMNFPVANGKGVVVIHEMIYEGTFNMGRPHGYGHFMAPGFRYYGQVTSCNPLGECLERTKQGLFVGQIDLYNKVGKLLRPNNQLVSIAQKR